MKSLSLNAKKAFSKELWLGDYDYKHLFVPRLPFTKGDKTRQPFFGLDSDMPVLLGALLGFQHSLSMLAGVMTPAILISQTANLPSEMQSYLVSVSLIVSGILSAVQITRFTIPLPGGRKLHIGTGLLSVVGTSFATITIVTKAIPQMYEEGICKIADDGTKLPCPDGYGRLLASSCVCALVEIFLALLIPAKILQKVFPPLVTGPVVLLIGTHLIGSGFEDWMGGSGCVSSGVCAMGKESLSKPWGSAEYLGLGFLVYVTIIICERWGSPIMKSCAVICGLIVGCIVAGAVGYFTSDAIDSAKVATFMWVHTFKLKLYGPAILPYVAVYLVLMMEAIGDITATCDVSRLPVEGPEYEARIQGGLLADGLNGLLAGLMTLTPMSTFAQNNGVITITKCANRKVGYWCCVWMIVMGIFSKFAGALVSIPKPVLGGMTSFLFTSVAVSGIKIISTAQLSRRDRFILTASLLPGFGSVLVPNWFDHVFTYNGNNSALKGFLNAIVLVMETGFAVTGFLGVILNLLLPEDEDDIEEISEVQVIEASSVDEYKKSG
ncbi:hypothetical protein DIURU_000670 [Diutina rugosa]|uniref:Uric acid-xanthine permease n=1 Tax=Diutina rugosa TaxID=5481 RepID=A0A642UWN7_DIURU|nr:uncharacterized protein DIURU_000670 [Diutina rugosa]KAA8906986.1 hypothetical protein DIURU_000670 [Diutina rugosa]